MEHDPPIPPYKTSDPTSFASVSAQERWPVILTSAIDDVHRTVASSATSNDEAGAEGKKIIEKLSTLKYELQHNRKLTPLTDDGRADIAAYNAELEQRGYPQWHDVSWLFSECYLYRRIATFFAPTTHWRSYDVFSRQKLSTFKSSRPAVVELAARYKDLVAQLSSSSSSSTQQKSTQEETEEAERLLFSEMCQICLWGNATDLSLLTTLTYADIQKLQGSSARERQEKSILVNDTDAAFARLKDAQKRRHEDGKGEEEGERRVDILLDNAGFELFVDLVLAGYLLHSGLATVVVLHPKDIPWFVSDVTPADFGALLNALAAPRDFYSALANTNTSSSDQDKDENAEPLNATDAENLTALFEDWSNLHADGKLVLRPNACWTQPGSYWRLPHAAPAVYKDLQSSELVIAKGDLHYRKLTGDVAWPATTAFEEAIGPLGGTGEEGGLRVLALRTCKADVVVGLREGLDEEMKATEGGGGDSGARKWAWSGKWAVVSFADGVGSGR